MNPFLNDVTHNILKTTISIFPIKKYIFFYRLLSGNGPLGGPGKRTPASSPASVRNATGIANLAPNRTPTSPPGPQGLSLQELTVRTVTMTRESEEAHHGFGICVKGGKDAGNSLKENIYIQLPFPINYAKNFGSIKKNQSFHMTALFEF